MEDEIENLIRFHAARRPKRDLASTAKNVGAKAKSFLSRQYEEGRKILAYEEGPRIPQLPRFNAEPAQELAPLDDRSGGGSGPYQVRYVIKKPGERARTLTYNAGLASTAGRKLPTRFTLGEAREIAENLRWREVVQSVTIVSVPRPSKKRPSRKQSRSRRARRL